MRASGFTFVRDAVRLRYPVVPSIRSVLPLVDEMVVNVGVSSDGTLDLVRSLGDPKIVVVESRWDDAVTERGRVLAQQTDIALERCSGDVAVYVQADEAIHEEDHERLRAALERLHGDARADGLLFDYVHFYGSFHTVGVSRKWYRREVRAVKLRRGVRSWRDAQGFRVGRPDEAARKPGVLRSGARMYHYGWVRPPDEQLLKLAEMQRYYHGAEATERFLRRGFAYDVGEKVRRFQGTHPGPMREWVERADWPFEPRPRWLRPGSLRTDLLDLLELATGIRVGEYRNYELLE
ncbi:MAG TPA: hypothetical protein VH880_00885 [Anaeromyxobacteraceae bacterium]|jgi:hypothetical protein